MPGDAQLTPATPRLDSRSYQAAAHGISLKDFEAHRRGDEVRRARVLYHARACVSCLPGHDTGQDELAADAERRCASPPGQVPRGAPRRREGGGGGGQARGHGRIPKDGCRGRGDDVFWHGLYCRSISHREKRPKYRATRDWEWRLCTEVIAHAVDQTGVALRVSADTKTRLRAIRDGTDDSFMLPEELVGLAPKLKSGESARTDWKALAGKNAQQLKKLWGRAGFTKGTTRTGLTLQFPDAGTRVARVLWVCEARVTSANQSADRVAQGQKDAGV